VTGRSKPRWDLRWTIVALLFAATAISYIDRQTLAVVAPVLREELGISNVGYAQILSAFLFAYTVMQAVTGWLIDRLGTRRGFAIIMAWWSTAAVLHAFGDGVASFSVYRFLLGAGEAGSWAACVKAVSEWFPHKERGLANSLWSAGVSAGQVLSVPLVAWVTVTMNWRYSFVITGLFGFIWLLAWLRIYRQPPHPAADDRLSPQDLRGRQEAAQAPPVRRIPYLRLLGWRNVWAMFLARVLADPCIWFYNSWIPEYLKQRAAFSMADIGRYAWIPFLTMGIGVLSGGVISDFLCRKGLKVVPARFAVMAAGALLMVPGVAAAFELPVGMIFLAISIATLGFGLWAPNMMTLHADAFPNQVVGSVTGLSGVGAGLGGIAFTMWTGWVVDNFGFGPVFVAVGIIPLLAFAVLYSLFDRKLADDIAAGRVTALAPARATD
jgi:ACS family hexuronate transporter-like MFS transporter